jgi:hypothetical protein
MASIAGHSPEQHKAVPDHVVAAGSRHRLPELSPEPEVLVIDNLTLDQTNQITELYEYYQPQLEAAELAYLAAAENLLNIFLPTTPAADLIEAREAVVTTGQVVNNLLFERTLALREVLTLEQRQEFHDYLRIGLEL